MPSENQRYLDNDASGPEYSDLAQGGQMMGLQDGRIFWGCDTLMGLSGAVESES